MNAEALLDSLKFRNAVNNLANTWRNKKAKDVNRIEALQAFLDMLDTPKPIKNELPQAKPAPKAEVFTKPEQAGLPKEFDPFKDDFEDVPLARQPTHAEIRQDQAKQMAQILTTSNAGVGQTVVLTMPEDFRAQEVDQIVAMVPGWKPSQVDPVVHWKVHILGGGGDGWRVQVVKTHV